MKNIRSETKLDSLMLSDCVVMRPKPGEFSEYTVVPNQNVFMIHRLCDYNVIVKLV